MSLAINGTSGISGVDGSASAPALQGSDSNTGVSFGTDTVNINTGGSTKATIKSDGCLAIGTSQSAGLLNVEGTSYFGAEANVKIYALSSATEARIGAGGITSVINNVPLTFYTADGGSNNERFRINSDGSITTNGNTSLPTGSSAGFGFSSDQFYLSYTGTGANYSQRFYNGNGLVGSILVNGSSTSYNTSSDYRLKENVVGISDGITRLKQLKPYKFNFIADKSTTFDGFFAHEAQAVVPESATGTKDEVESEDNAQTNTKKGDPIYQAIDQSKLVPLLTAALQEAIAKIEVLETKVAALEAA